MKIIFISFYNFFENFFHLIRIKRFIKNNIHLTNPIIFDIGGLFLSGPNIKVWTIIPKRIDIKTAAKKEGSGPTPVEARLNLYGISIGPGKKSNQGKYISPVSRMVMNVYAGYIAKAPWSRFMSPDPL